MEPKDKAQIDKEKEETAKRVRLISNEWRAFSKTSAYKEFIEYIELQDYLAIQAAKGPVNTFIGKDGEEVAFDLQKTAPLLQRSVGYDIVKTYVEGYVNITT